MTLAAASDERGRIWAEHITVATALSSTTRYARLTHNVIKKYIGLADAIL